MLNFKTDRAMSLHRHAYELPYRKFCALCSVLAERDDDPELNSETTTRQIWDTAQAARTAGMSKRQAFPLAGEVGGKVARPR